jgi:hypothetical protein
MAVSMAALFVATSGVGVRAQDPPKPAAAAEADPLKFDYNGPMILIFQVKPDKTADFEAFWPALRAGLNKSPNAELKAFAETLQPFRVQGVAGLYLFRLDPPSKTFTYNPSKLLYDNINYTKPEDGLFTRPEADALFPKLSESLNAATPIQTWKLEKVGATSPTVVSLSSLR